MSGHLDVQSSNLLKWQEVQVDENHGSIGKKFENALNIFKDKVSQFFGGTSIRGSISDAPPLDSAIQSLLGRTRDFKRLKKTLVDSSNQPRGVLKARCKEVVNLLFQNINTFGLSHKTVKHLYSLIKYGVYNLASKYGESKLPKTTEELINIWNNLGIAYVSPDYEKIIQELHDRIAFANTTSVPDAEFKKSLAGYNKKAEDDQLRFGLRVTRFQDDVEDLRASDLSHTERRSRIRELMHKFPEVEISTALHASLVRQAGEYLRFLPSHVQREQVFNMQSALLDSAKLAFLMSIGKPEASFKAVINEFEHFASPKLLGIAKGRDPSMKPRMAQNIKLIRAAKESGLHSLNPFKMLWSSIMGREAPIPIPVGNGRVKYYEAASVRSLMLRHAIVTGDETGGQDIMAQRETALKEMLKEEALSRYIQKLVPARVDHMMATKYKDIPLDEEEEMAIRKLAEQDFFMEYEEAFKNAERTHPGCLEIHKDYRDILQQLLYSYSVEAVRRMPRKYERFMHFLNVHNPDNSSPSTMKVASGYVVNILHKLVG